MIYLNPARVVRCCDTEFNTAARFALVNGDWDTSYGPFEAKIDFYRSFQQRLAGAEWQETDYYQKRLRRILAGRVQWECRTPADWDERMKRLEGIFDDIRCRGYRDVGRDRVGINIARDGTLLFNNGRHRLSFAKILCLEAIPVDVNNVHLDWRPTLRIEAGETGALETRASAKQMVELLSASDCDYELLGSEVAGDNSTWTTRLRCGPTWQHS